MKYWNAQGGAPKSEYDSLETERKSLNAEAADINNVEKTLNESADTLNTVASTLNRLAEELNLNVKTYNTVGASTGEKFDEGEYVKDASGRRINIYQYNDNNQLVRVLEHELGHSLGMDHVSDPRAIMYYLNQSTNSTPTTADVTELSRICGAPTPSQP